MKKYCTHFFYLFACWAAALTIVACIGCSDTNNKKREEERRAERESFAMARYNKTKYLIDTTLLEDGQVTDGHVVFKKPPHSKISKILNDEALPKGDFSYHIEGRNAPWEMVVCSFTDVEGLTEVEFGDLANNWRPDWTSKFKETIILNDNESTNEKRIFKRKARFSGNDINTVIWTFIAVQDMTTNKMCIITAFNAQGTGVPLETILNSLEFYNIVDMGNNNTIMNY